MKPGIRSVLFQPRPLWRFPWGLTLVGWLVAECAATARTWVPLANTAPGGTIALKPGGRKEVITITKAMNIIAVGGPATIGN